jgi:hypothetical protein
VNDTDRKQLAELFALIAEFMTLPEPSDYSEESKRLWAVERRARTISAYLSGETAQVVTPSLISSITTCVKDEMAKPLSYTPETPEQRELCACGVIRHFHDDKGEIHWTDKTCNGVTPAVTNEEEKAS